MHPYLLFALLFTGILSSYGQDNAPPADPIARDAIFAELGGEGMMLSVNYDRRFTKSNDGFGFRVGIGSNLGSQPTIVTIPMGINWLAGHGGNFIEFGAGFTVLAMSGLDFNHRFNLGDKTYMSDVHSLMGNMSLGYRRQPKHGGLNLRAGFTPFVGAGAAGIVPYFSLGYSF
ncbi:hypothetical protein [Puia sp.]|jgi:hypothetical protein|uniref:hypothetical protein n=1 Tax=Puia sp. TaxID=2045100 RepID=UPI002F3FDA9C